MSRFYGYLREDVHDRDGILIGKVVQAFSDTEENVDDWEVQWLRVRIEDTEEEAFIPATGGSNVHDDEGRLVEERVAFSREQVLAGPRCPSSGKDDFPSEIEEAVLYRHYLPSV